MHKYNILRIFRTIDRILYAFLDHLAGIFIAFIFVIVLAAVLFRYVLHASMQGIDEFNYYFMTLVIWVGSAATARNFVEGHIKVDLIGPYIKNKKIVDGLQFFWQILSVITIVIFTKLSYEYTLFNKEMRFTMSGMRFPMWIFFAFLSVVSSVITLYEVWNLVFLFRRLFLKRPAVGWEAGLPPGIAEGAQDDGSDRKGGV